MRDGRIDVEVCEGTKVSVEVIFAADTHETKIRTTNKAVMVSLIFIEPLFCKKLPNGLRYWRWGGRGFCLGAEKTRSQKNACKSRRIPSVQCTLCWAPLDNPDRLSMFNTFRLSRVNCHSCWLLNR